MPDLAGNDFSLIHNAAVGSSNTDYVQHFILNVLWRETANPSQSLHFKLEKHPTSPTTPVNIEDYMESIDTDSVPEFVPPRLYDINMENLVPGTPTNHTRFIVLQLHPGINWEFSPGTPGVSAKRHYCGEDADIRCLKEDGSVTQPGESVPDKCRLLSWHVLARPGDANGSFDRGFNFHIDFLDDAATPQRRLPTIFDPSVPNQGGPSIP